MELPPGISLTPEARVVIECARVHLDAGGHQRLRELVRDDLDWPLVHVLTEHHGVQPLVYRNLKAALPHSIPEPYYTRFRHAAHSNSRYQLIATHELVEIHRRLTEAGIPALPFKGSVLSALAYGNIALRSANDIDILVDRADFERAETVLLRYGYEPDTPLHGARKQAFLFIHRWFPYTREEDLFMVDLHTGFSARRFAYGADFWALWRRRTSVVLNGIEVPSMAPEDLLPVLCIHGTKHYWGALKWITDLAELIHACPNLDWDLVFEQTERLRSERMLYMGLHLARILLDVKLPAPVLWQVEADERAIQMANALLPDLFDPDWHEADLAPRFRYHLNVWNRSEAKARYFVYSGLALTTKHWLGFDH